jgi:flagellar hook-basal body complex protein FliE
MAIPISNALAAYANTAGAPKLGGAAAGADGPSFGDMLRGAAESTLNTVRHGEQKSIEGIVGKADLTDVVSAISNAETTLQAVVAVRDKVVSAYQEILRMPM